MRQAGMLRRVELFILERLLERELRRRYPFPIWMIKAAEVYDRMSRVRRPS